VIPENRFGVVDAPVVCCKDGGHLVCGDNWFQIDTREDVNGLEGAPRGCGDDDTLVADVADVRNDAGVAPDSRGW
jgi:hypothetical protein